MKIAVTGGKGGVGKSTVALNLAVELNALVVDGDLSTADLPHGSGPDLHDVLAGRVEPTAAVEQLWSTPLLPCGRTLAGARASNLDRFGEALERLERAYGTVVVDCPAGLARDVGIELQGVDVALLVTSADSAALDDAYKTRTVATKLDTPVAAVVLNKTDRERFEAMEADVEARFGAPVRYVPPRADIEEAQANWSALRDAYPESDALEQFEAVAEVVRRCRHRVEQSGSLA